MKFSLYYKLLVFHIVLAIGVFVFKPLALFYFLLITIFFTYKIFNASKKNKAFYVLMACAYIVGSEVFLRMNGGTFLYEASKYLVILYIIMGLFSTSFSIPSLSYIFYILLLIPGIFVAVAEMGFETDIRRAVAFNLSGPICLGISAVFCFQRNVSFKQMKYILLALALPIVSMMVYLILYSPNLQEVITSTGSNYATSGGFGPNQVATVLGLGIFVYAVRFFMTGTYSFQKLLDLFVLGLLGFRALVTFSRGGVITGIIMILCFIGLYYLKVNFKTKMRLKLSLLLFIGFAGLTWLLSSIETSGLLDKRYANQDAAGREKADISTGRSELIAFELGTFLENPFFGIGVGKVKEVRLNETGVEAASHNEMSRIVAEHGLFGLLAFLILLLTPLVYRVKNRTNIFFFSFYFFWLLTINHSAMRIAAPAFIYALCLLNITYDKPSVHRKPIIPKR
jgi:hypothetical protein